MQTRNLKSRLLDLAVLELNRKYTAALSIAPDKEHDHDWAVAKLQNDLAHLEQLAGKTPRFDSNYSMTWGFNDFGVYESLEEMREVESIIDGGF